MGSSDLRQVYANGVAGLGFRFQGLASLGRIWDLRLRTLDPGRNVAIWVTHRQPTLVSNDHSSTQSLETQLLITLSNRCLFLRAYVNGFAYNPGTVNPEPYIMP